MYLTKIVPRKSNFLSNNQNIHILNLMNLSRRMMCIVNLNKNQNHVHTFRSISKMLQRNKSDVELQEEDIILESINDKGIITLNRPKFLNVLNLSMLKNISDTLKEWEKSKQFVIIKGKDKVFSAGGDVRVLMESIVSGTNIYKDGYKSGYSLSAQIGSLKIPFVAIMNGITMGGGAGLCVHGDYRVATENTIFAMPETQIGFFPDVGASYFFPRLKCGHQIGLFLALSGHRLKSSDNLRAGIATHMCSNSLLSKLLQDLISIDSDHLTIPIKIEKILQNYTELHPDSQKPFSLNQNLNQINEIFDSNCVEEIIIKLKTQNCEWSSSLVEILNKMSPTSLKITNKLMRMGRQLDLNECLSLEYRIGIRRCIEPDFLEGVRALLIDKDQKPKWNPSKLADVSEFYIDSFFLPLSPEQELIL